MSRGRMLRKHGRRFAFGLLVFALLGVAAFVAVRVIRARPMTLDEAQTFIGAKVPAEAQGVQLASDMKVARILWLRFEVPAAVDLASFVTQILPDAALREGFTPFPAVNPIEVANQDLSWWTPVLPEGSALRGLYANRGDRTVEILVDERDANRKIVYVRAYSHRKET
jgi:hypothetical protein